jgi:ABC-2 type transport system permease protein
MRIFSAELYKIRKGKAFPITVFVNIAFVLFYAVMTVLFVQFILDMMVAEGVDIGEPIMMGLGFDDAFPSSGYAAFTASFMIFYQVVTLCAASLAAIWICDEFENGTIRNLLSTGKSRSVYYVSKLIVVFAASVIFAVINTAVNAGIITAFFGFGGPETFVIADLLMFFGGQLMIYFAYASIFVMAAFLLRHVGAALGVTIGYVAFLEAIFVLVLSLEFASSVKFLENLFPYFNIMQFTQVFQGGLETGSYLIAAIMCAVTVITSTAIGMITFAKRDVK